MEQFSLEWCLSGSHDVVKPIVVLFPWVWARSNYVEKYVRLCHQHGWDVLLVKWPMAAMWLPLWGRFMAQKVLETLEKALQQLGERPIVLYAFSGSAKGVLSSVFSLLARQAPASEQQAAAAASVLRCCVGCIYDSCPVDFTSDAGKKLLAPHIFTSIDRNSSNSRSNMSSDSGSHRIADAAGRLARSAAAFAAGVSCNITAGAMDFLLLERFEKDRNAMWTALRNMPVHGPVLFLYSRSDELADAAQIADLAASLRLKGHQVTEQVWQDTPHCGHYRSHSDQYSDSVCCLLSQALQEWSARSSRTMEGRGWAASWTQELLHTPQQEQQQQQQHEYRGQTVWAGQWASEPLEHQQQLKLYHASDADALADAQQPHQLQQQHEEQQQQQQLIMQHTRGTIFGSAGRKQRPHAGKAAAAQHSSRSNWCSRSSSSGSSTVTKDTGDCLQGSCGHARQLSTLDSSSRSGSKQASSHEQPQQHGEVATACCCPGGVLSAAAASADVKRASAACNTSRKSSGSGRGHRASDSQQQQSSTRDLTPLALLPHAADSSSSSGRSKPCNARAAAAAAAAVVLSDEALISACCGCHASECRCAETLAAASGEVVCSDSTMLSHSLRCMVSTHIGRQQQQQQEQLLRQQRQLQYHSSNSSFSSHGGGSVVPSLSRASSTGSTACSTHAVGSTQVAGTTDFWQQHVQATQLLQQQQQEQQFVQRVVSRLRSRL